MLKKIISILLIIIYSTASFGMSVKEYYCCGKLSSVSVSFNIGKEIKAKTNGCCKTKYHISKVKENHIASDAVALAAKHFIQIDFVIPHCLGDITFTNALLTPSNIIHGPPLVFDNTPIYIYNCVFRI